MHEAEAREKFASVAAEATDEEVERLSSAIHLGLTVMGMIESIGETREMMAKMGVDPDDGTLASSTVIGHKASGNMFAISVASATEADAELHRKMLTEASDLDEAETATKH